MVLRDWGEKKLLLFKLRYPPAAGDVLAKVCVYPHGSVVEIKLSPTNYLNTILAFWNNWDGQNTKCEFKYARDLSTTNVRTIGVTTNMLILDGTLRVPIP